MIPAMTARKVRLVLIVAILLILALTVGGFLFARKSLTDYAESISQLNADAQSGDQNIKTLTQLQSSLAQQDATIQKARSFVGDNSTYADQSLSDLSRIAKQSGVEITSFGFIDNGTSTSATTTQPAANPSGTGTAAPASDTQTPANVTKKTISVEIKSPLSYNNLMKFIRGVETNTLKMQLTSISMTKADGENVSTPALTIEVYVRQ